MYNSLFLLLVPILAVSLANACNSVGQVRIKNKDSNSYIQVCIQDNQGSLVWVFICGEELNGNPWTYDNAYVWCRSRGLKLASDTSLGSISVLVTSPELKLSNVSCNKLEDKSIVDCTFSTTSDSCHYLHGISCLYCAQDGDCNSPGHCNSEKGMCLCSSTCQNGGFCDSGSCQCPGSFYGEYCEKTYCSSLCSNEGYCLQNGSCQCQPGYYGDTCQHKTCSPKCQNGFPCLSNGMCDCSYPFYGESCQSVECEYSCLNGGECLVNGTCQCQPSFYGDVCEFKLCANSCLNGGECNTTNGLCECPSFFYGNRCELMECITNCEPIDLSPLQNNFLIIIISVGASISIAILLALILITSVCLIAVARNRKKPPPSAKNLGLKNLKEPPKIPEEPLYQYLDGSYCSQYQDKNTVTTTQFVESYASNNIYEYIHFPIAKQGATPPHNPANSQSQTIGISYNTVDTHLYETPFPISPAVATDSVPVNSSDRYTESYVKMYPVASCPALK